MPEDKEVESSVLNAEELNDSEEFETEEETGEETESETEPDKGKPDDKTKSEDVTPTKDKPEVRQLDKERQQDQQNLANARRRVAELEKEKSDLIQQQAKQKEKDQETDEEDPIERLNRLNNEQIATKAKIDRLEEALQSQREGSAYDSFLDRMDVQYGEGLTPEQSADLRNRAIKSGQEEAEALGYTLIGNDVPTLEKTMDLIEKGYLRVDKPAAGTTRSGTQTTRKTTKTPKGDLGNRGTVSLGAKNLSTGTPEEVSAAMRKEGKFKNYHHETE